MATSIDSMEVWILVFWKFRETYSLHGGSQLLFGNTKYLLDYVQRFLKVLLCHFLYTCESVKLLFYLMESKS